MLKRTLDDVRLDMRSGWGAIDGVVNDLLGIESDLQPVRQTFAETAPDSPEAFRLYELLDNVFDICRSHGLDV